jgi:hypothetical protein
MATKELPYDFDLHFDIKTFDRLQQEYTDAVQKVELLEVLCDIHDIPLKKD